MSIFAGLFGLGALGIQWDDARMQENAQRRMLDMLEQQRRIKQQEAAFYAQKNKSKFDDGDVIDIEPIEIKLLKEKTSGQIGIDR